MYGPGLSRPLPSSGYGSYSSLRAGATITSYGVGRRQGPLEGAGPDLGGTPAVRSGVSASRYRYVRIGVGGNAIQSIVIP